ncbi:MAG: hypothetical protein L3K05_03985, partial [Thermoplasmata archaeon]|nr:hypothetical protein [Thermoplasmata archaeon]
MRRRALRSHGPLLRWAGALSWFTVGLVLASGLVTGPVDGSSVGAPPAHASAHSSFSARPIPLASTAPLAGRSANWFNLSLGFPSGVPGNRTFAALAYDPALNGTLLFGGFDHSVYGPLGDTWLFANGTWTALTPNLSTVPSARWAAMLTWDPWNSEMVLFGGRDSSSTFNDTWEFNASGWTQLAAGTAPSPRQSQFSVFAADPT